MNKFDPNACRDYNRTITRRRFMGTSAGALAASAATASMMPDWFAKTARAACSIPSSNSRPVFIFIHLAGGPDGLAMIAPYGDLSYSDVRPSTGPLTLKAYDVNDELTARPLHGIGSSFFGLSPALGPFSSGTAASSNVTNYGLLDLWNNDRLIIAPATAIPSQSYSHFTAEDQLATGCTTSCSSVVDGFMANYLNAISGSNLLRGISLNASVLGPLVNGDATLPVPDPANFGIGGHYATRDDRLAEFVTMWDNLGGTLWPSVAESTACAIDYIDGAMASDSTTADFGAERLDLTMKDLANIIRQDIGLEMACLSFGGWDTHSKQGNTQPGGRMWNLMIELSRAVTSFIEDMDNAGKDVCVVFCGEFGRTARAQSNISDAGTDHGNAGPLFIAATENVINGGASGATSTHGIPGIIGDWGTSGHDDLLQTGKLHDTNAACGAGDRDLCSLTDRRDLIFEVLDTVVNPGTTLNRGDIFQGYSTGQTYGIAN